MLVSELKHKLEEFNDDDMCELCYPDGSWSNINEITRSGSIVRIMVKADSSTFSDE
jgi:hypothetical protein